MDRAGESFECRSGNVGQHLLIVVLCFIFFEFQPSLLSGYYSFPNIPYISCSLLPRFTFYGLRGPRIVTNNECIIDGLRPWRLGI